MYINTHSYFSLRYGTISHKELIRMAAEKGYDTIALTDVNNTSGCLDFIRKAVESKIKPVVGIDFRRRMRQCFVGIARNNQGYYNLNRLLTHCLHNDIEVPEFPDEISDVYIVYPFSVWKENMVLKDYEFIGVSPMDLNKLVVSPLKKQLSKLVILHTVSFKNKAEHNAHVLLRAVDNNTLLSKLDRSEVANYWEVMLSKERLLRLYKDWPQLIENTQKLLDGCHVSFGFGEQAEHMNLRTFTGSEAEDVSMLRKLCYNGLSYRFPQVTGKIKERLNNELSLIESKGFVSYFLINWDLINYARHKNYFYVGRGSGANSIVAYLLRITDVDPIELDLYFERFMNLYRQNPPDFDIDFSWRDRDDITEYLFKKYPNTALLGAYNSFKYKSIVRELGKVYGLPKHEMDVLSSGDIQPEQLDKKSEYLVKLALYLEEKEIPSHLSIHASGIIIADKPLEHFSATFMPPKGFPTTQYDMVTAEDVGLFKFDILSQRGLGKVKDSLAIIRQNNPKDPEIDIHDINKFKKDEKVKHILRNAEAIGCFYVESPAMRMLLKKLEVDNYLGLVAASSVIRPGVAKSGMMREYILRYRYPEKRNDAPQVLLDLMPETYGVMVYQEDVIKVAHYFAGLSLGEADVMRRGMSGKYRSRDEFAKAKNKFINNCLAKGYSRKLTLDVWRQVESFAGYAFAKGHSASYAVESYQNLYLKAHYPIEFMVSVLNNGGGFYSAEFYIHEARMSGATIHPPCVNRSNYENVLQGKEIYLGFYLLNSFDTESAVHIEREREQEGLFESMIDFIDRVHLSLEQLSILIRIDAFRFTGKSKRTLLWEASIYMMGAEKQPTTQSLFKREVKQFVIPQLHITEMENAFDQMELLGFPLCSPFLLVAEELKNNLLAKDMSRYLNKEMLIYGYLVTVKNTATSKGEGMNFGTFLDREGAFIDTVHFPQVAAQYPFRGRGVYGIYGKVVEEFGFLTIEVMKMKRIPLIEDPRYSDKDTDDPEKVVTDVVIPIENKREMWSRKRF